MPEYAYHYLGSYEPYKGKIVDEDDAEAFMMRECGIEMVNEEATMFREFMDSTIEWFFSGWDKKPIYRHFVEEPENPFDYT